MTLFLEGIDFWGNGTKIIFRGFNMFTRQAHYKAIKSNIPWKKIKLNLYAILYYENKLIFYWQKSKLRVNPYIDKQCLY